MNGREIENLLTHIDENILKGKSSVRNEILLYLAEHEADVLRDLRASHEVSIPTASGIVKIDLSELEALVA